MELIKQVKMYVMKPGAKAALASHFGFSSTAAIDKWIERKRIPHYHVSSVEKFLKRRIK